MLAAWHRLAAATPCCCNTRGAGQGSGLREDATLIAVRRKGRGFARAKKRRQCANAPRARTRCMGSRMRHACCLYIYSAAPCLCVSSALAEPEEAAAMLPRAAPHDPCGPHARDGRSRIVSHDVAPPAPVAAWQRALGRASGAAQPWCRPVIDAPRGQPRASGGAPSAPRAARAHALARRPAATATSQAGVTCCTACAASGCVL